MPPEPKFYVYTRSDPRTKAVFYVGKGTGNRAWMHTKDARKGKVLNRAKHSKIMAILKARLEPMITIVKRFVEEIDALNHEAHLIASLPYLTNVNPRGGVTGNRSPGRKPKTPKINHNFVFLKNWLARVDTWPDGPDIPGHPNGQALAQEFVAITHHLVEYGDRRVIEMSAGMNA